MSGAISAMAGWSAATWATIAGAGAAVAGAGAGVYSADQSRKSQNQATDQARRNALMQERRADEDMNRANQRRANATGNLQDASLMAQQGVSGTMLTGQQGVTNDQLLLGRNSLLGG